MNTLLCIWAKSISIQYIQCPENLIQLGGLNMVNIVTTQYYDEYLRYFEMAKKQQASCNLGITPYLESNLNDDLMHNVELYDVVERKYAGFSALVNDIYYG